MGTSLPGGRRLTDVFSTGLTVLGIERLEAAAAVRPAVLHDVALAAQDGLAFETGEVLHVPVSPLSLCALVCKDDLWTQTYTR